MVVLDAIVISPGEDIISPIPKLCDWLKRQPGELSPILLGCILILATVGEETEKISFDIFPLKCTRMHEGKEIPYEDMTPFGSRRMYTEE